MSSIPCYYARIDELSRFKILDALNPKEKEMMRWVCRQFDEDVQYHNPMQYGFCEGFMSQMGEGSQRENLDARLQRRHSLIRAAQQLPGGGGALNQVTEGGSVSLADPTAVSGVLNYLKEREVVGLIALMQQIPDTGLFLQSLKDLPLRDKSKGIENWMRENQPRCGGITVLELTNYKKEQLGDLLTLQFENAVNKVLNYLPNAIGNFSHLETLNVQNNLLNTLPKEIADLPLREINLSRNQFKGFPEVLGKIPTLTYLNLSHNLLAVLSPPFSLLASLEVLDLRGNPFPTRELEKLISLLPHSQLQIRVDPQHRLDTLIEKIRLEGSCTLDCSVEIDHLCYTLRKRESQSPVTPQMMDEDG